MSALRVLRGFTVGITADRGWEEQAALIEELGAKTMHAPTIQTLPAAADELLRRATEEVIAHPPDAVVLNTGTAVRSWLSTSEEWGLGPQLLASLAKARIYTRGREASEAVVSAGLPVAGRPPSERLRDAVDMALGHLMAGDRAVLQVEGGVSPPAEADLLTDAGARLLLVAVSGWQIPDDQRPAMRLAEAVMAGRVHAVTFTAGPAISNWLEMAAQQGVHDELRRALVDGRTVVGCLGPSCTEVASAVGLASAHLVQPSSARLDVLIQAIAGRLVDQQICVELDGQELVLAGTSVRVAGTDLSLTDTEARLFRTLAAQPNVVFTKEQLLRMVWGRSGSDVHAVEMGVARLRRRLGPYGGSIRAVHRRGYTLRT